MNWRPIAETKGKYEVSACGKIKSVFTVSKLGKVRATGTILQPSINHRGYQTIHLSWNENGEKQKKTRKIHRIVCQAFHSNPENKPQVNHKDLNQLNNHESNLEWATAKENTNHAQVNGRMPIKKLVIKGKRGGCAGKVIIDLQSGIFYNSDELAFVLGWRRRYVNRMLAEERKPNTSQYRYA